MILKGVKVILQYQLVWGRRKVHIQTVQDLDLESLKLDLEERKRGLENSKVYVDLDIFDRRQEVIRIGIEVLLKVLLLSDKKDKIHGRINEFVNALAVK